MNYKKIEEKYPKSWSLFMKWHPNFILFKSRDLYDFFDKQKIFIGISGRDFSIEIYYGKNREKNICFMHCSVTNRRYWDDLGGSIAMFKSRKVAERKVFKKAFEILESQKQA